MIKNYQWLDQSFGQLADLVSEWMGRWQVTLFSVFLIIIWLCSGPFFHFSDTWQLIVNTPTTIVELWIGFLLAAAANRVERRNDTLLEKIETQEELILRLLDKMAA